MAIILAREGASVVSAERGVEKGEETGELNRHEGGECFFSRTDVSMRQDVERLATEIAHTYGGLDCAINNAAIEGQKGFLEWSEDEWDAMVSINLKGVWLCMRSEIPMMLGRGGGAIVNISRSEEQTSELQSLMRISYSAFCL